MTQDNTTNVREFRKLEDLNLIDNFLFPNECVIIMV